MEKHQSKEELRPGDSVTLENRVDKALPIRLCGADGLRVELELQPGQQLEFTAGDSEAQVVLHEGDPSALLIIKPELPS